MVMNEKYEMENTIKRKECISDLSKEIKFPSVSVEDKLKTLSNFFPGKIVFSTSFGIEDQLITHFILSNKIPIKIFTLDTGRFFEETYKVWNDTNKFYGSSISVYYPNQEKLEEFLSKNGPNSFYDNVENRVRCCFLRKVEPLKRALQDNFVWITGLRAEHSTYRKKLNYLEWDFKYRLIKYHPLYDWKLKNIEKIVKKYKIPYNSLYDKGFLSIGCAPCTRPVRSGESYRSGRWWWEDDSIKKECGLHIKIENNNEKLNE